MAVARQANLTPNSFTTAIRGVNTPPSTSPIIFESSGSPLLWADRRLLRQCRHGDLLGNAQARAQLDPRPLIYMSRSRLRSALFDYIEIFYNRERAQAGLGHLSPLDYEASLVVA